jgi:hypothetical protein
MSIAKPLVVKTQAKLSCIRKMSPEMCRSADTRLPVLVYVALLQECGGVFVPPE